MAARGARKPVDVELLKQRVAELEREIEDLKKRKTAHESSGWYATQLLELEDELCLKKKELGSVEPASDVDIAANTHSFKGCSIVCCGILRREVDHLVRSGFLDADRVLYTAPGLHERPEELERQLIRQLKKADEISERVIVLYGKRCFFDPHEPFKTVESMVREHTRNGSRINAGNCIDMLASEDERRTISGGDNAYWLSPGWAEHWKYIFKEWDVGLANETFPKHGKAILLDAVGFFEDYAENHPERVLEFSDWMKIGIEPHEISLDRLKELLIEQLGAVADREQAQRSNR